MVQKKTDLCLIGAGPIGIEMAIALQSAGISYIHLEKRQIAQTIWWYPPQTRFFSSADRIAIAGIPVPVASGESKASREEYLAYLRAVIQIYDLTIQTYTRVKAIRRDPNGGFLVNAEGTLTGKKQEITCDNVIVCTGDMHSPNLMEIPGEELPHVSHYFHDAHPYFRERLLVVGGGNSAVEAAVKCHHAGARVSL